MPTVASLDAGTESKEGTGQVMMGDRMGDSGQKLEVDMKFCGFLLQQCAGMGSDVVDKSGSWRQQQQQHPAGAWGDEQESRGDDDSISIG
ncbi:unnamed protein product [Calypogeia fissa]